MDRFSTMEFLDLVWGREECYVDVPSKAGGHWIPWNCEWPADRPLVRARIDSSGMDREDIYFSVARFSSKGRRIVDVLPTHWLWADLDRVDPVYLDEDGVLPTLAWESSSGRYQCLWQLTRELRPHIQTKLNRRLTNAIGADKGGYDLTQVLRPIDTWNFKYEPPCDVELLWYDENLIYDPKELSNVIRTLEASDGESVAHSRRRSERTELAGLPARARRLLRTPPEMVVVGERSARLWELEKLLAREGLSEDAIFTLVWPCAWNKHREVRTGENQLRREIAKAMAEAPPKESVRKPRSHRRHERMAEPEDDPEAFDLSGTGRGPRQTSPFVDYATFLSTNIETPRWLIENLWAVGSRGIIGGEPKTSKSTFALPMALSVATGKPFLGIEEFAVPEPGPVLLIQEENAPWAVQDLLRKFAHMYGLLSKSDVEISEAPSGSVVDHIIRLNFPSEAPLRLLNNYGFNLNEEEDLIMLEEEVRREGTKLVIIDPLYLVMGGVNLNNSHEVGPLLQWLMALSHNHNCAVALVHHWSKANENSKVRRSGQRLLGTAFFHGWLESGLYMEKLDGGDGVLSVKVEREFRYAPPMPEIEMNWQIGEPGELDLKVQMVNWDSEARFEEVLERLLKERKGKRLNLKYVAAEVGGDKREVALTARELGYKVKKHKYPNGYAWEIDPKDPRRNGNA